LSLAWAAWQSSRRAALVAGVRRRERAAEAGGDDVLIVRAGRAARLVVLRLVGDLAGARDPVTVDLARAEAGAVEVAVHGVGPPDEERRGPPRERLALAAVAPDAARAHALAVAGLQEDLTARVPRLIVTGNAVRRRAVGVRRRGPAGRDADVTGGALQRARVPGDGLQGGAERAVAADRAADAGFAARDRAAGGRRAAREREVAEAVVVVARVAGLAGEAEGDVLLVGPRRLARARGDGGGRDAGPGAGAPARRGSGGEILASASPEEKHGGRRTRDGDGTATRR
jgi:hypothetical protein